MKVRYSNAKILHRGRIEEGELWCAEGVIVRPQEAFDLEIDLKQRLVVPGYIDLQINGLGDNDLTSNPESVHEVSMRLLAHGVTGFLPTLISSSPAHYRMALPTLQGSRERGARILGIHLEGPFFNPLFCGAHSAAYFRKFEGSDPLIECFGNLEQVKMVTLAPELSNARSWIQWLRDKKITVAAGHTNCSAKEYLESGVNMATHLFNAMTPFHHRAPGLVGAILGGQTPYSIIADGVHVDPLAIKMAWQANPKGLILISDGSSSIRLGEKHVIKHAQSLYLADTSTLAGSVLTMDQAVRNFKHITGCSMAEAIEAASLKPAQMLGLGNRKGLLEEGYDGDFLMLDEHLHVLATFIAGKLLWRQ